MRPNRNDPTMQARLMKLAKKGPLSRSASGSSSELSDKRGRGLCLRGARRDVGKRHAKEKPRRDTSKSPLIALVPEVGKRTSVDPVTGPLEPWVDMKLVLSSYHEAVKRMLKVEVVEGLFTEEMGYNGYLEALYCHSKHGTHCELNRGKKDEQVVTAVKLSKTIGEKAKVEEELLLMQDRLEAEMRKNAELLSSMNKLAEEKRGVSAELSTANFELSEAKQKIEAFAFELRTCCDDAVNNYVCSTEY
ncbi:unnamed protein product [Prunus armeniaca]